MNLFSADQRSQMMLLVMNLPANAGVTGDMGSIPGLGRSPEKEMTAHSSILAWGIPWTEKAGGLQSLGSQRMGHNRTSEYTLYDLFPSKC